VTEHRDLTFATVDVDTEEGPEHARLVAWGEAVSRGFYQQRFDDQRRELWLHHTRADGAVLRGAWPATTGLADPDTPVATYASWAGRINVGGDRLLDVDMISDITVAPTHRRRGLLRRLITDDLRDAAAAGFPLAALTVSEGTIYGRFGFGPATRLREVEVDVRHRFALHAPPDEGTLELVEPEAAWPSMQQVFARHLETVRGALDRPSFYSMILTGTYDWFEGHPDTKMRAVVHLDRDGRPDGYAVFKHIGWPDDRATLELRDLLALSPEVDLRLWRFVADLDLVHRVRWRRAPAEWPLEWAVTDPRVVTTTKVNDMLWLRVLDVPAALQARPWGADGDVVVEVGDALGHADGRWRVTVRDGAAEVAASDDEPGVRMTADVLGSLYLGGVGVRTLHDARRLGGSPAAVEAFAAMADTGPAPYCTTGF
jgi:predicted acetyltransferase